MTSYQEESREKRDGLGLAVKPASTWLDVIRSDLEALRDAWRVFCRWCRRHGTRGLAALAILAGTGLSGYLAMVPDSPSTPGGMLALELPGTRSNVLSILALLKNAPPNGGFDTSYVTRALLADFVFVLFYVSVLNTVLRWGIRRRFGIAGKEDGPGLRWVDRFAWQAPLSAGVLDYIENLSLLMLLHGGATAKGGGSWVGLLASLTTVASLIKWTLLTFIAIYFLRLLVLLWWRWVLKKKHKRNAMSQ